jgi:tRNA(Ile)-lysidine synthase TilS/MesJ
MAAYCVLKGIDYIVEECPNAVGNKHLGYKTQLNAIEEQSPGSKAAFYFGFLERISPLFASATEAEQGQLRTCPSCGAPTTAEVCAFCRLAAKASTPR